MPSTYTPNLNLELIENGEQDGTWGETTNANLEQIDAAIAAKQDQGDKGDKGDQGDQGAQGITGEQGIPGSAGTNGSDGSDGTNGTAGEPGEKGDPGIAGETGASGPNGAKGDDGEQGAAGTNGTDGIDGDQGIQGNQGETGASGPNGDKGDTGDQGIQGPAGPTEVSADADNTAVIGTDNKIFVPTPQSGGSDDTALAFAKGAGLAVEQGLLAAAGQPAMTVLAVAATTDGKVQGVSLGAGNTVEVFATGADYNANNVLYREFMALGEPICFTGLSAGAIITSSAGFYGVGNQVQGAYGSPMPLMSLGLAWTSTFVYCFRNSQDIPATGGANTGQIIICCGALPSSVSLKRRANGVIGVVEGQENIPLEPFELVYLYTNGNSEYILEATNPVMGAVQALMGADPLGAGANPETGDPIARFYDARLIMPLTNDGITWPRSGYVSAPYADTVTNYFIRDDAKRGSFVTSPGQPTKFDAATGANDTDYEPNGATRVKAVGLISAYSGADTAGLEASPMMPTSGMSQVVAVAFHVTQQGDGGNSGVAISSPYEGTAKVMQWNPLTSAVELAYTVPLNRGAGFVTATPEDQNVPSAGMVAQEPTLAADPSVIQIVGTLNPGFVLADVPITVVIQNGDRAFTTDIRSQNGTTSPIITCNDDETLMLGHTPPQQKAEIVVGTDDFLYKRIVAGPGPSGWELA